jgi:hypothetical protein
MRRAVPTFVMAFALTACTDGPGDAPPTPAQDGMSQAQDRAESATPARKSLPCPAAPQRELVGRRKSIVGHSFGWPEPFRSPPRVDRRNKILWELQRPGAVADTADLLITASLNDSEEVVHRRVEGHATPGRTRPSIIDVPKPGCWTFSLTWGAERDAVSVRYKNSG